MLALKRANYFQDVTGTTIYVVGVICVIPAAGLVAWIVRFVVRKKVKLTETDFTKLTDNPPFT